MAKKKAKPKPTPKPVSLGTDDTLALLKADFKAKAGAIVKRMSADRDELRNLLSDYEEIFDSIDDGLRDFEDAILRMSELM